MVVSNLAGRDMELFMLEVGSISTAKPPQKPEPSFKKVFVPRDTTHFVMCISKPGPKCHVMSQEKYRMFLTIIS